MTLDPQAQLVLEYIAKLGMPDHSTLSPTEARVLSARHPLPPGPAADVSERRMPVGAADLALRVYRPEAAPQALGGLVYFHGGGFVVGDLDGHDALCRELAVGARCAVVSVDYRLAPEHKFPTALDDAYAATCWVHEHADELGIDHNRLAVGGDSAGGNLATGVARLAKERRNPPLVFQLLLYPVTDLRSFDNESYAQNAAGMFLTRSMMVWYAQQYLRSDADRSDPRASPLCATNLIGVPPALLITAEHDPLRDEGAAYAELLKRAHTPVTLTCYPGMIHGFVSMYAFLNKGREALKQCTEALAEALR